MAEANTGEKKPGMFAKLGRFFKEVKNETKKIVWPNKTKALHNTIVVVVFMVMMGVLIALVDLGLGALIDLLYGLLV